MRSPAPLRSAFGGAAIGSKQMHCGVSRGEHLRARVALEKVDLDAAAGALHGEAAGLGHLVERIVELALAEL